MGRMLGRHCQGADGGLEERNARDNAEAVRIGGTRLQLHAGDGKGDVHEECEAVGYGQLFYDRMLAVQH
jgi:hypothetical protein